MKVFGTFLVVGLNTLALATGCSDDDTVTGGMQAGSAGSAGRTGMGGSAGMGGGAGGAGTAGSAGAGTAGSAGRGGGAGAPGMGGGAGAGMDGGAGTAGMDGGTLALWQKLGDTAGTKTLVDAFVGKVLVDTRVNAFFSNVGLDAVKLKSCLVHQVLAAAGKPGETYTGEVAATGLSNVYDTGSGPATVDCRNMVTTHAGMGISTTEFDALVEDFLSVVPSDAGITAEEASAVTAFLNGFSDEIVEDPTNNATIYARLGGKRGILTALAGDDFLGGDADFGAGECGGQACFVAAVATDATIGTFFAGAAADAARATRLVECLQRQLAGATGGPDQYDAANGLVESRVGGDDTQCTSMLAAHAGMGVADSDFETLAVHLVTVLDNLGVAQPDIDVIAGVLTGQQICQDIVENNQDDCATFPTP